MLFLDCSTALRNRLSLSVSPKCGKEYKDKDWKQFKPSIVYSTSCARSSNINQLSLRANNCIIEIIANYDTTIYSTPLVLKSWPALSHCQER